MTTLGELAAYVRSKNAGPFWMTFDVFFGEDDSYKRASESSSLEPEAIGARFAVAPEKVRIFRMAPLKAIKISIPRPSVQGSFDDRDMHSGQQFVLLEQMEV